MNMQQDRILKFDFASPAPTPFQACWLITFGDLVTLLLCFFLVLIPMHVGGPPKSENSPISGPQNKTMLNALVQPKAMGIVGTRLAITLAEEKELTVGFEASDFEIGSLKLTESARERLKNGLISDSYQVKEVKLVTCGNSESESKAEAWVVSVNRALALRSQILDADIPSKSVAISVRGPFCENAEGASVIARVVLR